jgi:hypothetical protein
MDEQTIHFSPLHDPIVNPLMGWAPWATIEQSQQPHTLVYADLTWREFEPQEGQYDFDSFERKQQLDRWRQEGKRVVFRFVADIPGSEMHSDIPDWLFARINGSGDYYDNEYGKGFSPDYSNLILIEAHRKAIHALGERYGNDGFFAFIELGSLGHWGEWHIHPGLTPLPSENIRDLYVSHYLEAFPHTHLLMRRPFTIAESAGLGLYNDMTADPVQTSDWLDWIVNGGESSLWDGYQLVAMPNGWKKAPVGGEQAPTLSNEEVYRTNLEQTLRLLRESHTTFIGPGSPYKAELGGSLQSGLDQVMATIGYRLFVDNVQIPRRVYLGHGLTLHCTLSNNGIAPIYYNWPTYFYLFDKNSETVATVKAEIDLRQVLPGTLYDFHIRLPVDNLKNGTYSIGVAIVDPITNQPAVKFANENSRMDLIQELGSFEVRKFFNRK